MYCCEHCVTHMQTKHIHTHQTYIHVTSCYNTHTHTHTHTRTHTHTQPNTQYELAVITKDGVEVSEPLTLQGTNWDVARYVQGYD